MRLAALRRLFARHERIFRFLHSLSLQEQAAAVLEPGAGRVVVLAPHMDDEVLGCGGTIARHADAGARISFVFLTDGRYGAAPGGAAPADLLAARRNEALAAARELGVTDLHFIAGTGNRLETDAASARQLRAILERLAPDAVYLPFALERHPDHRATANVLAAATSGTSLAFDCRAYEVWTPLVPNRVVAIDGVLERKRTALRCYRSQLEHTDFEHVVLGLNAYRSSIVPGGACRHAEAFHVAPLDGYLKLHREVLARVAS